ncbi:alpha/beta fold hydrolase [Rhodococcoides kyotonense]|uniref:Alpha/beta hydrolase family protein n=1 Tax=Rhodococcoides kyotonense TaxID=398843 RepID=A0A239K8V5_9NOCA|nr:alpha/beta hydrolase [Rhodococcus kyotonensis]SNT14400.1 Alpha/beta hydrolase family protein [Rhodococcus kyotonensis]
MATIVLVPGSWEGAWTYNTVAAELEIQGHTVHSLTLSGLDGQTQRERVYNLDDHIDDVVTFIVENDLRDVVLAAHSYGGMVATGVCAMVPERCRSAVYIDAFLPERGDSCWMLMGELLREGCAALVSEDGRFVLPGPGADERSHPHPIASLLQASKAQAIDASIHRTYIHATGWRASPFKSTFERLRSDPMWTTYEIDEGHEVMRYNPYLLSDMLAEIVAGIDGLVSAAGDSRSPLSKL